MRKTTLILIVISILAVLFISACTKTTIDPNDECAALEDGAKDNCYDEANKCSKIENDGFSDSCVAKLAAIKGDLKVCDLIENTRTRGYCQEEIAVKNLDSQACRSIEDTYWKDNCNHNIALNTSDDDLCSYVGDDDQRRGCYYDVAIATNNVDLCSWVVDSKKNRCVTSIAIETESILACNMLSNGINVDACKSKVAREMEQVELCAEVGFDFIREKCLEHFNGESE